MRKLTAVLFSLVIVLTAAQGAPPKPPKLVVAILVDQLRYDYMDRFDHLFAKGGFKTLTEKGAFMTFAQYNYAPTITGPGHASFFSGSTPMMHGIIANDWYDKRTGEMMYCAGDAGVKAVGIDPEAVEGKRSPKNFIGATVADQMRLHFGSKVVGISIKDRGAILPAGKKPTGAYWFDSRSGNFITSTYYMEELPAWVKAFNDKKVPESLVGQTWERLLDEKEYPMPDKAAGEAGLLGGMGKVTFPHRVIKDPSDPYEPMLATPYGNQLLAEFAKAAIEGEGLGQGERPDVLCVSFSSIDYCGHRFGPYSQEVQDITLRLDRQLEELFGYLDQKLGLANVVMVLTADHAVAPVPENAAEQGLDGGRPAVKQALVELNKEVQKRFGEGEFFVMLKEKDPKKKPERPRYEGNLFYNHETLRDKQVSPETLTAFIREWAMDTGLFHAVYGREQLLEGRAPGVIGQRVANGFNAERNGDVVLVLKPFLLEGSGKPGVGTTHGSVYSYDTHVPVMFFGEAFKPGRYADEFYITDIAPTLSAALGIQEPPMCMGKPLTRALK